MDNKIGVLFSGGVDSSLVATIAADKVKEVHLITCITQCLVAPDNMKERVNFLRNKYPDTKFVHVMLSAKNVLKRLWNGEALKDLFIAGIYRTYPCANCKLSMHIRALVYCIENNVKTLYCGANVMMSFNPEQNYKGINILKEFYRSYGIEYDAPVFWYENVDIMLMHRFKEFTEDKVINGNILRGRSTSDEAIARGVGKGDMKLDVKNQYSSQPLCTQSTYSTYFLLYFYLPLFGFDRLENVMHRKMRSHLAAAKKEIDRYIRDRKNPVFENTIISIDPQNV